jgi:hypothetical protein
MARQIAPRVKPGTEDFEILFSEFSVSVSSVSYEIHEYTIIEGMRLGEAARKAVDKYKEGESADLIYLIAENCGRDPLEIAGLNDATLTALAVTFERANKSWFTQEAPKPGRSTERWSSVMQGLISHGHTLDKIRNYTLRQVYLFHDAIGRLSSRERVARIVDVSLGFSGGDQAKDAVKSLKRAGE